MSLKLQSLGLFPAKVLVCKMTILGCLEVDWLGEVEFFDDDSGAEIEVGSNDLDQLVRAASGRAIALNEHGKRLSHSDGV